jgi:7-keto-8-aminopelargonate synthetase-like enzyme
MMTSGYTANEGLLACVITPDDWVASDELNHASIIDGLRLTRAERFIYRHQDLNQLADGLRSAATKRTSARQLFIVTESLFGMEGDVTPLRELAELAERFEAHVLLDEAHATGCYGPSGAGLIEELGIRQRLLASVHTGGKALGVAGAYIAGSSLLRDVLINRCRHFIFTTALPPQLAAWWLAALPRVRNASESRRRLHANAALFRGELLRRGIRAGGSSYIVPILVGQDEQTVAAAARLQARGWDIRAIRPPSVPEGTARLRVSIHANHEPVQLTAAADAIAAALA